MADTDLLSLLAGREAIARGLDPSGEEMEKSLALLTDFSLRFLKELPERPAWEGGAKNPVELRAEIPERPGSLEKILDELSGSVLANGINPTSGRFFGYVPGGGLPSAALGDYLAALTNKYSGVYYASPGAAEVENATIRWMRDLVGFPKAAWGTLQSGGTLATLTAVVAARETRPPAEWMKSVVYLSTECHLAAAKALHVAGLGAIPRRLVAVDAEFRMSVADLERHIAADRARGLSPWILFASAGTVNTGAVDPIADLAAVARREKLWLHVDAAYGGFFILCEEARERLAPMALADSLVLDPHKGLFLPYGCGAVLVRDGNLLRQSQLFHSDYLPPPDTGEERSPADYSPELTRHFRGLRLWLSLKLHGLDRFRAALDEKLLLARLAHRELGRIPGIELGPPPQLSCAVFRVGGPDERTESLREAILKRGRVFLSPTKLGGKLYLRVCVLCFRSHRAELEALLGEIRSTLSPSSP